MAQVMSVGGVNAPSCWSRSWSNVRRWGARVIGTYDTDANPAGSCARRNKTAQGHEQTSRHVRVMSVIPLKADIHQCGLHVRLVPQADIVCWWRDPRGSRWSALMTLG